MAVLDNCDPNLILAHLGDVTVGTCAKVITRTYQATDACGNVATCTQTITVSDTLPPTITCPSDLTVCNDPGQCAAVVRFTVTATDNCGVVSLVCAPPSGATFPKGATPVTCTAADAVGNTASCSFNVTVNDCEAPTAECVPTTNRAGGTVLPAGNNPPSGKNPDGFYQLLAGDNCDATGSLKIYVKDAAEGPCGGAFAAGPYAPGTKVKLTQSPGQASVKPMAGEIVAHINTRGEPLLVVTDSAGNTSICHKCFVPPPPK
jgi:hypothetical protein